MASWVMWIMFHSRRPTHSSRHTPCAVCVSTAHGVCLLLCAVNPRSPAATGRSRLGRQWRARRSANSSLTAMAERSQQASQGRHDARQLLPELLHRCPLRQLNVHRLSCRRGPWHGRTNAPPPSSQHQVAKRFKETALHGRHQAVSQSQILGGMQRAFARAVFHLHPATAALRRAEQHARPPQLFEHRLARGQGYLVVGCASGQTCRPCRSNSRRLYARAGRGSTTSRPGPRGHGVVERLHMAGNMMADPEVELAENRCAGGLAGADPKDMR